MKRHAESHLDHGLTDAQVAYIFERFADRDAFFIETFELPEALGTVPCALRGPVMGDAPVTDEKCFAKKRGTREYASRCVDMPMHQVRQVTVIAGPHEERCMSKNDVLRIGGCNGTGKTEHAGMHAGAAWHEETCDRCGGAGVLKHACILYTAFGGPLAPQEPGDIRRQIRALEAERLAARKEALARREAHSDDASPTYAKIVALREKRAASDLFWAQHALAASPD